LAVAGLAVGPIGSASGQTLESTRPIGLGTGKVLPYGVPSHFASAKRVHRDSDPSHNSGGRYLSLRGAGSAETPLEDLTGIITPSGLHFVLSHAFPDLDPRQHRLLIQGMVERPLILTMEEVRRLPFVSRICFIECGGNGTYTRSPERPGVQNPKTAGEAFGGTSCSEWTGVLLPLLLQEVGVQKGASWVVAEGAEAGWTMSIPLEMIGETLVAYGQNGEDVRPEQGFPLRLVAPGMSGDHWVKWLRRIVVTSQPVMSIRDSIEAGLRKDGRSRLFKPQMPVKSVITFPSGGQQLPVRGFYEISGIAWSGGGRIRRVEVSTDGGRTYKDAQLQEPVLPKAWTRFCFPWNWDGAEAIIQSRTTDEQGEVQLTVAEMARVWGATVEEWKVSLTTPTLFNPIQPWRVDRDGSVHNALFS